MNRKMSMNFALFRCCATSIFLKQYESSTDAVLRKLGVKFVEVKAFNCCGYPLKNISFKAFLLSSARNLALAGKAGVHMLTFCNCCYGALKHAQQLLNEDESLRRETNEVLEKEGLRYEKTANVRHLLELLHQDIGLQSIRERIERPFRSGLRVATHYGCHLLRPSHIVQFDSPMLPSVFDDLVQITGAESVSWSTKLDCCGSPAWGVYDELSLALTQKKILDARKNGAAFLCVSCAYCQIQFDRVQEILLSKHGPDHAVPSILYTQLLGLSLGLDPKGLGIEENRLDLHGIMNFIS